MEMILAGRCRACEKGLTGNQAKFCSTQCQMNNLRAQKVTAWLEGNLDGRRGKTATAMWIRWWLIKQRGQCCWKCGWAACNPHTGNIPPELNHIDGDFTHNQPDNLELICPNCHSLTASYKGANKKGGRPRSKYYRGL